jgi:hypothetical protein
MIRPTSLFLRNVTTFRIAFSKGYHVIFQDIMPQRHSPNDPGQNELIEEKLFISETVGMWELRLCLNAGTRTVRAGGTIPDLLPYSKRSLNRSLYHSPWLVPKRHRAKTTFAEKVFISEIVGT